jgi:UDP-N-acetylglucosamine 2-epimerase
MKTKLVTIVGTRPEIIKLSQVILKCDNFFEHIIIHTGQNYDFELNQIFFDDLKIRKPNYFLDTKSSNLGESIAKIISKSYKLLKKLNPDAVLILGDTNSCLSAISAKRLKIPIFHMEAGNRCFDQNVPEEINRKIVDHISDINLPYTENAKKYLLSEGIRKDFIFKSGSPMKEIFNFYKNEITKSKIL